MTFIQRYMSMVNKAYFSALRNGFTRAKYLRKHNVLAGIGENVYFYSRIFPADPKLLKLGSNVVIATNVRFLGHDRVDIMLNGMLHEKHYKFYDCIEVGDNVFIGADCLILPGVKIGSNTIIGAGAVVSKDLPPGSIWGGVPAKRIGDFNDFISRRRMDIHPESDPDKLWESFDKRHSGQE